MDWKKILGGLTLALFLSGCGSVGFGRVHQST